MGWFARAFGRDKPAADNGHENEATPSVAADQSTRVSETPSSVRGDSPIRRVDDDTLSRSGAARSFAEQVLALDVTEGVVVGVLGPWGSGKTSFVNLARIQFERVGIPILDFNPWMFSGAQQLVESFFVELAAQLRLRPDLADVGKDLEEYGETFSGMGWLPLVGPWIERGREATKILAKILQRRREGVGGRRQKLEKALAKLDKPIIVVLDDIDRLSTSEIRDVFKLVRLTASFPNVVYVVAFDRTRVEEALAEQGIPGRDYLEKILQVAVDIPAVPTQVLNRQIFSAIDGALAGIENPGPFDQQTWPDAFAEIVRPLVRSMRDVRRYALAVRGTVAALGGQVALADVLALEAIRVFLPDVFARLPGSVDGLTTTSDSFGSRNESPHLKSQVEALVQAAEGKGNIVDSMIRRLFPAGTRHLPRGSHYGSDWLDRWLRERRVAHEDILRLYLERVAGENLLAFYEAEKAWSHFADRGALESYLRSIDIERLQDVIGALESYEDQFAPDHVVPASIVLLNLLPELPERKRGMFEFSTTMVVTRVTYRLLRSLKDPAAIETAVRAILPEVTTLSSKLALITQVGHREGAGHRLVSEEADKEMLRSWRAEVRSASGDQLGREWDLLRVVFAAKFEADSSEGDLDIPDSPDVTLGLLRAARGESRQQSVESRAVRRFPRLDWDALVKLFGDEAMLRDRIGRLAASHTAADAADLLSLANKYLDGWRPKQFGED